MKRDSKYDYTVYGEYCPTVVENGK